MGLFKGFGFKWVTIQKAVQPEAPGQTFILEPMLTPTALVEDPTHEVGAIEALHPMSLDPLHPADAPAFPAEKMPIVPLQEFEPIEFIHTPELSAGGDPVSVFTSGVFTVGHTGEVRVDYLFDGGAYQGELALFNLQGMEPLELGSPAFIQEAARRALSGTELGHVVIHDVTDAARFTGAMPGEGSFNSGDYPGVITVKMAAGSQFGVMLVPNGTVQQLVEHPDDSTLRPLFSLATANPQHGLQFGQIADVNGNGHLFAMEDLRVDGHSDRDYNDIIFRVDGTLGSAPSLESLIAAQQDWRRTELGHDIAATEPFNIDLEFCHGFTDSQKSVIEAAARSVEVLITQGLPDATIHGERVDDLRIQLSVQEVDGPAGTLARTRLDVLRSDGTLLPLQSLTQFDRADLADLEQSGKLFAVMQHELLSALGFGTLWEGHGLVANNGTPQAEYIGMHAVQAFHDLGGLTDGIPIEPNRLDVPGLYWNERLFQNELMTYDLGGRYPATISPITLASLQDLGYQVDLSQADERFRLMGGLLAPKSELTAAQWAAWDDLKASMTAGQGTTNPMAPATTNDGWMYSSATALSHYAGQPNILWRNMSIGGNGLWLMQGTTLEALEGLPAASPEWEMSGVGDFDGDGNLDLVWREPSTGQSGIWLMNGTDGVQTVALPTVGADWRIAGVGDFDQDQIPDLLWRRNDGSNGLWLMNRDGSIRDLVGLPTEPTQVWTGGIVDLNGDGKMDILWRDYATGANRVWWMNGTTVASSDLLPAVSAVEWSLRGAGNFNGDEHPDLLWRNLVTGDNGVWLMNGTQVVETRSLFPVTDLNWMPLGVFSLFTPVPTELAISVPSNTAAPTDPLTRIKTPIITGQAFPGTLVKLYDGGNLVGQARASTDGSWQIQTLPLADGIHSLAATATDIFGLASALSHPLSITIDSTAPGVPTLHLAPSADTGRSDWDGITALQAPTFTGKAEAGATVQLFLNGTLAGQTTADTSGSWQFTPGTPLVDGIYQVSAKAVDAAGNISAPFTPIRLIVDTQSPAPPSQLSVARMIYAPYVGSQYPLIVGSALPDSIIQLYDGNQLIGQTTTGWDGRWYAQITTPLPDGTHTVTALAIDAAGNSSPASDALSFTVDSAVPYFILSTPLTGTPFTSTTRLTGTASGTGSSITMFNYRFDDPTIASSASVTIPVNSDGSFDVPLDLTNVSDGPHTLYLAIADQSGSIVAYSFQVTVYRDLPDAVAPVITASLVNDTAPAGSYNPDGITANPAIHGFVSDDSRIVRFRAGFDTTPVSNYVSILADLQADGSFALTRSQIEGIYRTLNGNVPLPEGAHTFKLQAQDEYGNLSEVFSVSFTLDTTPPSLTVSSPGNNGTLADTARLVGQVQDAHQIASVTYHFGNQASIPVVMAADGSFNQPFDFAGVTNGSQQLTLISVDIAGNVTRQTIPVTPTLTTLTPPTIAAALVNDSGAKDGITNNPTISGTLNPARAATLWATLGDRATATSVNLTHFVNPDGTFTLSPEALAEVFGGVLPDGEYSLLLQPKDANGNEVASLAVDFTLDTTSPSLSVDSLLDGITWNQADGERLEGDAFDALPGTSVVYFLDGNDQQAVPLVMNSDGAFNRSLALNNLPLGAHTLTVRATDTAGNARSLPYSFQLTKDTPLTDSEADQPDPPPPPQNNQGGNGWPNFGFDSDGGGGGGWGWGWTYGGSGGGGSSGGSANPGFWAPPDYGYGYGLPEPTIPYAERIRVAIETAAKAMPFGARRAALRERKAVLVETAKQIGAQIYDRFQTTLYGIYYLASSIATESQAKNLGYYLASQLKDPNDPSVRVQTFQQNLLTAVDEVLQQSGKLPSGAEYSALEQAVMRMAYTYSLYNPAKIPDSPNATAPQADFLNRLWWAQNEYRADQLDDGIDNLKTYLQGVNDPAKAIGFVSNLLLAAKQVVSIREDLKDPLFFQELIKFGFEYAKLNPDTSLSAAPQGFLDTLWRTQSGTPGFAQAIRKGASGLSDLFAGSNSKQERLKRLKFAHNLVEVAKQTAVLQQQIHDPALLNTLIELSGTYAPFETKSTLDQKQDLDGFFLNTTYLAQNSQDLQKGAQELREFFSLFDDNLNTSQNRLDALWLQQKILKIANETSSSSWENLKDPFLMTPLFLQEGGTGVAKYPTDPSLVIVAQSNPNVYTRLHPWEKRFPPRNSNPFLLGDLDQLKYNEEHRQTIIKQIEQNASFIHQMAREYNVSPDAIAGAILWEAAENPYPLERLLVPSNWPGGVPSGTRHGILGKIHVKSEHNEILVAELVEQEGRVPPLPKNTWQERAKRLKDPKWAIRYIAAIMDRSAEIYERTARNFAISDATANPPRIPSRPIYNIRDDAGVLTTLYQGGRDEERAISFENRRARWFDVNKTWNDIPQNRGGLEPPLPLLPPNEKMGSYVSQYRWWIRHFLLKPNGCPPEGFLPDNSNGNPPPGIPTAQDIPIPSNIFIR